jgi:adenosyl cobinamide kinase/adenosyl cobinamide phosphate guanylyltransferase
MKSTQLRYRVTDHRDRTASWAVFSEVENTGGYLTQPVSEGDRLLVEC